MSEPLSPIGSTHSEAMERRRRVREATALLAKALANNPVDRELVTEAYRLLAGLPEPEECEIAPGAGASWFMCTTHDVDFTSQEEFQRHRAAMRGDRAGRTRGEEPMGADERTIKHICGGSEGCMCVYDPECNPNLTTTNRGEERMSTQTWIDDAIRDAKDRGMIPFITIMPVAPELLRDAGAAVADIVAHDAGEQTKKAVLKWLEADAA